MLSDGVLSFWTDESQLPAKSIDSKRFFPPVSQDVTSSSTGGQSSSTVPEVENLVGDKITSPRACNRTEILISQSVTADTASFQEFSLTDRCSFSSEVFVHTAKEN